MDNVNICLVIKFLNKAIQHSVSYIMYGDLISLQVAKHCINKALNFLNTVDFDGQDSH